MKKSELKELIKECYRELNETPLKDKIFKLWFGKSKADIEKRVKNLSDEELKIMAKWDWSKSGGAQKVQGDAVKAELKRRLDN